MTTTGIQLPLERGEKLLWSGVPRQGLVLRASDALTMRIWGIPFVVVGAYVTIGRFVHDAWRRSGTTYAVTTERVIIAASGPFASLKSLNLGTLTDVILTERPDGSGTIAFGRGSSRQDWGAAQWGGGPPVPTFEMIPTAKQVYNILRDARARLAAPSAVSSLA